MNQNKATVKKLTKKQKEDLEWLLDVLISHKIWKFEKVNLHDYAIAKKYHPNCKDDNSLKGVINRWIDRLTNNGYIIGCDYQCIFTNNDHRKPYYYDLDYIKVCEGAYKMGLYLELVESRVKSIGRNYKQILKTYRELPLYQLLVSTIFFGKFDDDIIKVAEDDEIEIALNDKYPQLPFFQKLADEFNFRTKTQFPISFKVKKHRNTKGEVYKISIRAFRASCSYKDLDKIDLDEYSEEKKQEVLKETRQYFLNSIYGEGNWKEFDVTGSCPRLARFINLGIWESLDSDPYEQMFRDYILPDWIDNIVLKDGTVIQRDAPWELRRKFFKEMFMSLYYGGTVEEIFRDGVYKNRITIRKKHFSSKEEYEKAKNLYLDLLRDLKQRVKDYCGIDDAKNTEVFLHESCIYISVILELEKMGIDTFQVYDAFFMEENKITDKELKSIIEKCAKDYYKNWIN